MALEKTKWQSICQQMNWHVRNPWMRPRPQFIPALTFNQWQEIKVQVREKRKELVKAKAPITDKEVRLYRKLRKRAYMRDYMKRRRANESIQKEKERGDD